MSFKLVLTMANSIIGVSILAMPFCYKQCGILLATLMLILSSILAKVSCHLLVKAAIIGRSRTYEFLAFHTFGLPGKLAVEISMIGFMMGTCTAFFVVIGDLAPPIIANIVGLNLDHNLRLWILISVAIFVVTPLCLLRNLDSLTAICALSLIFYGGVTVYIILTAKASIWDGEWVNSINWWRPAGIFQCLPIFTMALSGQAQVFEIYEVLADPSVSKMNQVVSGAVNLCAGVYMSVGFFGYIAHHLSPEFGGNILTAYNPSVMIEIIKIGFSISVAMSFPLVVFPCRTSIHSLVFKKTGYSDMIGTNYIPPNRFTGITLLVVACTAILGIMIPDIEFVLGLVGATIGNVICILLPAIIFLGLTTRNTTERLAAHFVCFVGILVMVLGTFVGLHVEDSAPIKVFVTPKPAEQPMLNRQPGILLNDHESILSKIEENPSKVKVDENLDEKKRVEPAVPNPPEEEPLVNVAQLAGDEMDVKKKEEDAKKLLEEEANKKRIEEQAKKEKEEEEKKEEAKKKMEEELKKEKELKEKEEKAEKLLQELEKQKEEHKQIIEEQKEVLDKMKQHLEADEHQLNSINHKSVDNSKPDADIANQGIPNEAIIQNGGVQGAPLGQQSQINSNLAQPRGEQGYPSLDKARIGQNLQIDQRYTHENNAQEKLQPQSESKNIGQNHNIDMVGNLGFQSSKLSNQNFNPDQNVNFNLPPQNQGPSLVQQNEYQPLQDQGQNQHNVLFNQPQQNLGHIQGQNQVQQNVYINQRQLNLGQNQALQNEYSNNQHQQNQDQNLQNMYNNQPQQNQGPPPTHNYQQDPASFSHQGNAKHPQAAPGHDQSNQGIIPPSYDPYSGVPGQSGLHFHDNPLMTSRLPIQYQQQQHQLQQEQEQHQERIKKDFKRDVHDSYNMGRDLKFFNI